MHRAFLLEEVKVNISCAKSFGSIEYIFEPNEKRSSIWSQEFLNEVITNLKNKNYNSEQDYFLVTGHMVPVIFALLSILDEYRYVKCLFYSATDRTYVERIVSC